MMGLGSASPKKVGEDLVKKILSQVKEFLDRIHKVQVERAYTSLTREGQGGHEELTIFTAPKGYG